MVALDFTGHGASTMPIGGGYTAEILMADVDAALDHLDEATVVGRGLGAYVALLISGARADRVRGVVLADGPGLSGWPERAHLAAGVLIRPGRLVARPVRAGRTRRRPPAA